MNEKLVTFPMIKSRYWWLIRILAAKLDGLPLSAELTAKVLRTDKNYVKIVILPVFKQLGLIDEARQLTDLGKRWSNDKDYKQVCTEIIERVYTIDLIQNFPSPKRIDNKLKVWFIRKTLLPDDDIVSMAQLYILLSKGNSSDHENIRLHDKYDYRIRNIINKFRIIKHYYSSGN